MNYLATNIDSKSELYEKLFAIKSPTLLLTFNKEQPNEFLLLQFAQATIELETYHFGIRPQIYPIEQTNSVLIGHSQELIYCSIDGPKIIWRQNLDDCFFEFKIIDELKMIIVISETAVTSFNFSGRELWRHSASDIIIFFEFSTFEIKIVTMDEHTLLLNLKTGLSRNRVRRADDY